MIQRYRNFHTKNGCGFKMSEDGEWCGTEDVDKLEKENEKLQNINSFLYWHQIAQVEKLLKENEELKKEIDAQKKMIEMMAENLAKFAGSPFNHYQDATSTELDTKQYWIEYLRKKAEEGAKHDGNI